MIMTCYPVVVASLPPFRPVVGAVELHVAPSALVMECPLVVLIRREGTFRRSPRRPQEEVEVMETAGVDVEANHGERSRLLAKWSAPHCMKLMYHHDGHW